MDAQSTPVTNELRTNLGDEFDDISPIRQSRIRKRKTKHFWKRIKREISRVSESEDDSDAEHVIRSQVDKSSRTEGNTQTHTSEAHQRSFFTHNKHNNSCDLVEEHSNLCDLIEEHNNSRDLTENQNNACDLMEEINNSCDLIEKENGLCEWTKHHEYSSNDCKTQCYNTKLQFLDSGLDKILAEVNCDYKNLEESKNSNQCNTKLVKNELFIDEIFKNEVLSDGLSVSDIMKWSEKSLIPQGNNSYFSSLIKQKLLSNACNNEILKNQATGWTQYEPQDSQMHKSHKEQEGPFYGLPSRVQELYRVNKGIKELFSWQEQCLGLEAVKEKRNLVYSLPTSGGKSLVAEILMLRELLVHQKNVLLILPFVSLVQEKIRDLSQFALEFNFSLEEYAAGKGVIPPRKHRKKKSLMIATIEKGLIIVNSLIEANRLEELGLVVVDELHLLSELGRGSILEILLIQILTSGGKIQIIGMTATIGNLAEVATFLNADTYVGQFRPVHLQEYIKCGNKIYSVDLTSENLVKEVRSLNSTHDSDVDAISQLVEEVAPKDSVLVFCATKKNCENVANLLSHVLPRSFMKHQEAEKASLYRALVTEMNEKICPILKYTVPYGVAYHHSGLTVGERKLLEEAFRQGTLAVICCTSTLAVGVNLPAKRVILRSPYVGREFISISKYKQMVGRAGRTGLGSEGESFLICQPMDMQRVRKLFVSDMDETTSKLDGESCKSFILSSVGLSTATTVEKLKELLKCSLLHKQSSKLNQNTEKMVEECTEALLQQGALKLKNFKSPSKPKLTATGDAKDIPIKSVKLANDSELLISRLGRAAMKGGLSMETAHELYGELKKAQSSLVLLTDFHLLYLVTPFDFVSQIKPNFSVFFHVYMQLDEKDMNAANVIGINESVISKLAVGRSPKNVRENMLCRFYISLILHQLWNQKSIWDAAQIFQLSRGLVQTLMTSAATFVNNVLRFCEELEEFWSFKCLLTDFAPRLAHCCAPELLPLMDLPAVKRGRAKQLYEAGYKTVQAVARAKPAELVRALDHMPFGVANQIVAAAKLLLLEKVDVLREEAENVLESLTEDQKP